MQRGRLMGRPGATSRTSSLSPMSRSRSPSRPYANFPYRRVKPTSSVSVFQAPVGSPPERKDITQANAGLWAGAAANGTITLLNPCTYGTASNQHIGRKIVMKSFQIRTSFQCRSVLATLVDFPNVVRIIVVYDKETNGAAPVQLDILAAADGTAPMNLNNADRFIVIMDKELVASEFLTAGAANMTAWNVEFYKKMSLEVVFNAGSGGVVGDIQTGGLFALTYCVNAAAAPAVYTQQSYSRVRFTDA